MEKIFRLRGHRYQFPQVFRILWLGFYEYLLGKDHELWFYKFSCVGNNDSFSPKVSRNKYIDIHDNNVQNQQ